MMETIRIRHATGEIEIILSKFFPTTMDRLKQFIKYIRLDWENQDAHREKLRSFFKEKLEDKRLNKTTRAQWERHLRLIDKEIKKLSPPPQQ